MDSDYLVIGGGVVGTSIAYGLAQAGERVRLLDEGDDAFRAARGNFGLVWVQGKGVGNPAYARWTLAAAERGRPLPPELRERHRRRCGAVADRRPHMCLTTTNWPSAPGSWRRFAAQSRRRLPVRGPRPPGLRELLPQVGPDVAGATFWPAGRPPESAAAAARAGAGLQAAAAACAPARAWNDRTARRRLPRAGAVRERFRARRVVLAAGLGNRDAGADGRPQRAGQTQSRADAVTRARAAVPAPPVVVRAPDRRRRRCRSVTRRRTWASTTAPRLPAVVAHRGACIEVLPDSWRASTSCAPGARCA